MPSPRPSTPDPRLTATLSALNSPHVAVTNSIAFQAFHNALRIVRNIEGSELVEAGVIDSVDDVKRFQANPYEFFIRAEDHRAAALWLLIQKRQPADLRADERSRYPVLHAAE